MKIKYKILTGIFTDHGDADVTLDKLKYGYDEDEEEYYIYFDDEFTYKTSNKEKYESVKDGLISILDCEKEDIVIPGIGVMSSREEAVLDKIVSSHFFANSRINIFNNRPKKQKDDDDSSEETSSYDSDMDIPGMKYDDQMNLVKVKYTLSNPNKCYTGDCIINLGNLKFGYENDRQNFTIYEDNGFYFEHPHRGVIDDVLDALKDLKRKNIAQAMLVGIGKIDNLSCGQKLVIDDYESDDDLRPYATK